MSNHPDGPPRLTDRLIAVFINDESELRSGWRILVFVLVFAFAAMFVNGIAATIATLIPSLRVLAGEPLPDTPLANRYQLLAALIGQGKTLVVALIASFICARWLERRTLPSVGFKLHRGWAQDFALGSLLGAAALALAVGLEAATGAVRLARQITDAGALAIDFAYLFAFFVLAAAIEELLFRGFAFQALVYNLGGFAAIAITSVFFGLAHIKNANASTFSTINTILAGVWLGVAYLMTRSLWLATALHYSWNLVMVFVFGLPVSGITSFQHLAWWRSESRPPVWISGGEYGPEAGAAATLALLVVTLVIWRSGWFRATPEMLAAVEHGKPERPLSITADGETASR
ncbi:MAG: CPBP family intramembrane glutamic endopeptidase [Blastocatellia bacterium]